MCGGEKEGGRRKRKEKRDCVCVRGRREDGGWLGKLGGV